MTWSYAGAGLVNLENEQSRYCVEGDRLSIEVTDIESGAPFRRELLPLAPGQAGAAPATAGAAGVTQAGNAPPP